MKGIVKILFLSFLLCINTYASFERGLLAVTSQALGGSTSKLFFQTDGTREISLSRNVIMPTMFENNRINYEQGFQGINLGFYYNSFGDQDVATELSYIERTIASKINYEVTSNFSLGGEVKKHMVSSKYEQIPLTGNGYSVDLGMKFMATPSLNLIFEMTNIGGHIKYNTERYEELASNVCLVLEKMLKNNSAFFLKADQTKKLNIGYRFRVNDDISFLIGNADGDWAGGLSIRKDYWKIDYACSYDLIGTEQQLGFTRTF